jgi:hypothetical protein
MTMDAASFLSSTVEIAIGIAGFSGIVAAIRRRSIAGWPPGQRIMLQILFFASAAAIVFSLLPPFLFEAGIDPGLGWKISGLLLTAWIVLASGFRVAQSRAETVPMPIPRGVMVFAAVAVFLQLYNLTGEGRAWPYLVGVVALLANGFSMFLLLLLGSQDDESGD